MKEHQSAINFREKECFRRTPESPRAPFASHNTSSGSSSKDANAARIVFCAIRPTADNTPNLEDPRHAIPKCLTEANKDSLDQMVDHLRSTCGIIEE